MWVSYSANNGMRDGGWGLIFVKVCSRHPLHLEWGSVKRTGGTDHDCLALVTLLDSVFFWF